MFLLDSLLMAPGSAAFHVFTELARKAQDEWLDDDAVKRELQELYVLLEAGRISDKDFEERECRLLERLEQIAKAKFRDKWGEPAPDTPDAEPPEQPALPVPATRAMVEPPAELVEPAAPPMASPPPVLRAPAPLVPAPAPLVAPPAPVVAPVPVAAAPVPAIELPPPLMPVPVAAVAVPPARATSDAALTVFQVIDSMMRSLALLKLRVASVTSVTQENDGWRVTAELIERKGVPDTNDLLGFYEFRLDGSGNIVRYERTRMRRRGDLNRS